MDQSTSLTLADRALARLRKIATGNGIEPAAITVLEVQEQIFSLGGTIDVSPLCETENSSYPGSIKGKVKNPLSSFSALQQAVAAHRQAFSEDADWIEEAIHEIKTHPSEGWGLDEAKVTLTHKSETYAATENCPSCNGRQLLTCTQCNGQGTVVCTQCQGQGREQCYYCGGRGENPQQPGQLCTTCNGTRFAPCRFCQTRGHLACPTCGGKRGTPCPACRGTGKITQAVTVTCGALTHFTLKAEGLPSGLRRGLDRVGIMNLGKGHADITVVAITDNENEEERKNKRVPVLTYKVLVPYAELRMGLGSKKAIVSVFGKRCAIMGVPPFLDTSLQSWRTKLHQAALGKGPLEEALEVRALSEILSLTVNGNGRVPEVLKLYPFGFSTEVLTSILSDMQLALNQTTLKTRLTIAFLCVGLCAALFYALFVMGFEAVLTHTSKVVTQALIDLSILVLALGASWALLNFSTRFVLRRRFPQLKLALKQKIGKTGLSMLAGILGAFVAVIMLAPIKPLWLALVLKMHS